MSTELEVAADPRSRLASDNVAIPIVVSDARAAENKVADKTLSDLFLFVTN